MCFTVTAFQSGVAWSTPRAECRLVGWAAARPGSHGGSFRHSGYRAVHRLDPPATHRSPRQPTRCRENHVLTHRTQDLYLEYRKNSQTSTIRANNSIKTWAKDLHRHFTKEGTRMAKKCSLKWRTLFIIRKTHVKAPIRSTTHLFNWPT